MKYILLLFVALLTWLTNAAPGYTKSYVSKTYVNTRSTKLSCDISMDSTSNKLIITMVGPSTVWYGFGFGNTVMSDTYSIIVDGEGNVEERYLIGTTAGNSLDDTFTVESSVVSGSTRTTVISRELNADLPSTYHYKFSVDDSKLETIYGWGTTSYLDNHGVDQRGDATLSMTRSSGKTQRKKLSSLLSINFNKMIGVLATCVIIMIVVFYAICKSSNKHNDDYFALQSSNGKNDVVKTYKPNVANENDRLVIV